MVVDAGLTLWIASAYRCSVTRCRPVPHVHECAAAQQGYIVADDPPIWQLHLQGELRRLNGERSRHVGNFQFRPEG